MTEINEIFETDRLFLKPTDIEDADFIFELMNTPKWMQFIGDRKVKSKEAGQAYIKNKIDPDMIQKLFEETKKKILEN